MYNLYHETQYNVTYSTAIAADRKGLRDMAFPENNLYKYTIVLRAHAMDSHVAALASSSSLPERFWDLDYTGNYKQ